MSSLQAYFTFLLKTQQIERSPMAKHKSLKAAKKIQVPFSENEMMHAMNLPPADGFEGIRNKLMVELFYSTGIRRAELIAIKMKELTPSTKSLSIRGKGNKERLIPILPFLSTTLSAYLDQRKMLENIEDQEYLF